MAETASGSISKRSTSKWIGSLLIAAVVLAQATSGILHLHSADHQSAHHAADCGLCILAKGFSATLKAPISAEPPVVFHIQSMHFEFTRVAVDFQFVSDRSARAPPVSLT